MHGSYMHGLKRYVVETYGEPAWRDVVGTAGLGSPIYLATETYPDGEIVAVMQALSQVTGRDADQLLEDYGRHLIPSLLKVYAAIVQRHWTALDLIEHTETSIHRVVRMQVPNAAPPELQVTRIDEHTLQMAYTSKRQLCAAARGMALGVGDHYGEELHVVETTCMRRGDAQCTLVMSTARTGTAPATGVVTQTSAPTRTQTQAPAG